jgi:hypothetical protein
MLPFQRRVETLCMVCERLKLVRYAIGKGFLLGSCQCRLFEAMARSPAFLSFGW